MQPHKMEVLLKPPCDGVGWRQMPTEPRGASQDVEMSNPALLTQQSTEIPGE